MTPEAAKSTALGCVIATGAIASVSSLQAGHLPPLRVGIGTFVAGAFLLAIADEAPQVATGFGLLLLAGAVLRDGVPAAASLKNALS